MYTRSYVRRDSLPHKRGKKAAICSKLTHFCPQQATANSDSSPKTCHSWRVFNKVSHTTRRERDQLAISDQFGIRVVRIWGDLLEILSLVKEKGGYIRKKGNTEGQLYQYHNFVSGMFTLSNLHLWVYQLHPHRCGRGAAQYLSFCSLLLLTF